MTDLDRAIGAKVAETRCQESHRATAEAAGLSVDKLRKIERGEQHPTLGDLRSLACALGTKVESLFPGGEIPADYH